MVYTFSVVDVKEYIASGILESVVFGLASEQERKEVQCMMHIYPEIKAEMDSIEAAFEKMAFSSAVPADPCVKEKVLEAIGKEPQNPADNMQVRKEAKVVQLSTQTKQPNPWKWIAAASVVITLGAGFLWFSATQRTSELSGELANLQKEQNRNEQLLAAMKVEQDRITSIQAVLTDQSTSTIRMDGKPMDPTAKVKIMWSDESKQAVIMAETITPPPSGMQYQLWAIADGKPISLGMFDYDEMTNMTEPFDVAMDKVDAFAITMEKRGGSPVPTMENMIVMGTVEG